jgi:hypothetical protein
MVTLGILERRYGHFYKAGKQKPRRLWSDYVDGEIVSNIKNKEKFRSTIRSIRSKIVVSSNELRKGHNKVWKLDQDILIGKRSQKESM